MLNEMPKIMKSMLALCTDGVISAKSEKNIPYIEHTNFWLNEEDRSLLLFISKKAKIIKILKNNPQFALTVDIIDTTNPTKNTGLLIEGIVQKTMKKSEIRNSSKNSILIDKNTAVIKGKMHKIVAWRGPYFKRWIAQ